MLSYIHDSQLCCCCCCFSRRPMCCSMSSETTSLHAENGDDEPSVVPVTLAIQRFKKVQANLVVLDCQCESEWLPHYLKAGTRCLVSLRQTGDLKAFQDQRRKATESFTIVLLPPQQRQKQQQPTKAWLEFVTRIQLKINVTHPVERNRHGIRLIESEGIIRFLKEDDEVDGDNDDNQYALTNSGAVQLHDKTNRHALFADWLVRVYGKDRLCKGNGVLDVAGGKGCLSQALFERGIPSIVLDPDPRYNQDDLVVIPEPLYGDGSSDYLSKDAADMIRDCSIIIGMHPDQATEAIIDTSNRLGVPFALLPCCVMPSLFPWRRQKSSGDPVRSYQAFCQYLLDKAPDKKQNPYHVDILPFHGRHKIIYSLT